MISKVNRNIRDTLYASKVAPGVSKSRDSSDKLNSRQNTNMTKETRTREKIERENTKIKEFMSRENTKVIKENEVVPNITGREKSNVKESIQIPFERELSVDSYNTWVND